MKTPDAIKKGLELCAKDECFGRENCPYASAQSPCVGKMCSDALSYINQLEARVPKWISVQDMEPEDNTAKLVFMRNSMNHGFFTSDIQAYIAEEWNGVFPPWEVTHWMPLPEMPKEE